MSRDEDLLTSLLALSTIVEARDPYTGGHLWRVSQFARALAQESDLAPGPVALAEIGGFLHDLGKIGVPDDVLNKPGRLSDAEMAVMRTHPEVGSRILARHPMAELAVEAVGGHHERPDGRGYPLGLVEGIPRVALIVAIADAFDAMTSTRPYRPGMAVGKALEILSDELGRQFDRRLGETFVALGERGDLAHIVDHSAPGLPLQRCPGCGGPLALPLARRPGDIVCCRLCGGESRLEGTGSSPSLAPTGRRAPAASLAPQPDHDLIAELVAETAPHVL